MGTTIFAALPPPPLGHFDRPRVEFEDALLVFWPSPHADERRLALTRFHLARRFWNHIFTW
jgi:hypothetical protein